MGLFFLVGTLLVTLCRKPKKLIPTNMHHIQDTSFVMVFIFCSPRSVTVATLEASNSAMLVAVILWCSETAENVVNFGIVDKKYTNG